MVIGVRPSFALRGVVEGFYGPPWSHRQRLDLIEFFHRDCEFNIYIYAPHDDPFHRERWMDPYPPHQRREFREIIDACKKFSIEFCFGISPGLSVRYSSEEDFDKLTDKLGDMSSMGARWFGLFFDDIPEELRHEADRKAFGGLAEAQAFVANRLERHLKSEDVASNLILCPTQYYLVQPTPYLKTLGEKVLPSIYMVWTGRGVESRRLTCADADTCGSAIKRKPFVWDNYPANDYDGFDRRRLLLGPYRGREKRLPSHVSGIVSNPMNEAEASKIPLLTIADYLRDPDSYDPERSWSSVLRKVAGKGAYAHLKLFAEQSLTSPIQDDESLELRSLIKKVWENWDKRKWKRDLVALKIYLGRLHRTRASLSTTLENKQLHEEIKPYLEKLELLAALGQRAVKLLEALRIIDIREDSPLIYNLVSEVKGLLEACSENKYQLCGEYRAKLYPDIAVAGPGYGPQPEKEVLAVNRESVIVKFARKSLRMVRSSKQ